MGAVTWFRAAPKDMMDRLQPLLSILNSKGVTWERSVSADPGRVIYEDHWQVGVIPLRYPGKMGPSDWFEVRKRILSNHQP